FRVRLHEAEGFRRIVKARPLCEFAAMSANIQNRTIFNRRKPVKKLIILKVTTIQDPSDFGSERERLPAKVLQGGPGSFHQETELNLRGLLNGGIFINRTDGTSQFFRRGVAHRDLAASY